MILARVLARPSDWSTQTFVCTFICKPSLLSTASLWKMDKTLMVGSKRNVLDLHIIILRFFISLPAISRRFERILQIHKRKQSLIFGIHFKSRICVNRKILLWLRDSNAPTDKNSTRCIYSVLWQVELFEINAFVKCLM